MLDAGRNSTFVRQKKIDREISALKKNLEMLGSLEM
ncbi:hypothetical protein IMSAGC003_01526 [Lachnospiraceae bacterium]|nr:hypothetical protein IMSAGC003_01526 [Lachnospiraceae bacterium]